MLKRFFYRAYLRVSANQRWFTRRFSPGGLLVLTGVVVTAAIGANTDVSHAYLAFSLLATLLFVSFIWSLFIRPRFTAERVLPRFGSVATPLRYEIRLTNLTRRHHKGLVLFENLIDPRPSRREFMNTPEPDEERRNWWDRNVGWYRWVWLTSQKRVGQPQEAIAPSCPAYTTVPIEAVVLPLRRGALRFEGLTVGAPDPFGMVRALRTVSLPQTALILPKRYRIASLALPGTRKYQRGGVALASSVGESEEFVSLRDYRPGDPLKHIHWRSWARIGRPIVKEFQDEFFVRHALVLDTFGTLARSVVFEEAVSVAASFACAVQTQESLLDLMFVGSEAFAFTAGRGLAHAEQMLEVLAGVSLRDDRPFSSLRNLVLQHSSELSGCILVFIQWDSERADLLRQLQALGVPVMAFVVAMPGEAGSINESLAASGTVRVQVLEVGKVQEELLRLGQAPE